MKYSGYSLSGVISGGSYIGCTTSASYISTINTTPYIASGLYNWGNSTIVTESIEDIVYYKVIMKVGNIDKNNVCMKKMKAWLKKQI